MIVDLKDRSLSENDLRSMANVIESIADEISNVFPFEANALRNMVARIAAAKW